MTKPSLTAIKAVMESFSIILPDEISLADTPSNLTNDSRSISSGDIFCAIIGFVQDGRKYINQAIENGAVLVIAECETEAEHGSVSFVKKANEKIAVISFYQLNDNLYTLASAYYQSPENTMTMIGLTGTNGKTSTSQLLAQILTSCQKTCAIIGTNGAGMVNNLQALENTTPSATDLVQLFSKFSQENTGNDVAQDDKITHLAMEVSSHALHQGRINGNAFDIAVFTNLTRDHLDYHGSMEEYAAAKRQLFTHNNNQIAVLNGDDAQTEKWIKNWQTPENLWLYGRSELVRQHGKFVSCSHIKHYNQGVDFILNTHLGDVEIYSSLLGDFNIDNLLAVIAVLLIEGVSLTTVAEKITAVKAISGRMEAFSAYNAPTAVVDYAHTPDALEKALSACRQHCHGNLYVVFGCGGDRDKGKRPLMAKAAQQYADFLVVTNDNPRTEAPMDIINDILAGLDDDCQVDIIIDRKQAVQSTLAKAQVNDVVLLAGKGHEDYIILGHDKINYNERQVVQDFFDGFEARSLVGENA